MSDPGSAYLNKPCRERTKAALDMAKQARADLAIERPISGATTLAAFDRIITLLETTEAGEGPK